MGELLASGFGRERKLLVIADVDERLVNIDAAVVFGERFAGCGGVVAFVTDGRTRASLEEERRALAGVAHARHDTREEVTVVVVVDRSLREIPVGTRVGEAGSEFLLVAQAIVRGDIPGAHVDVFGAETFVGEAGEGPRRRRRSVLGEGRRA